MELVPFDEHDWNIWSGCESPRPLKIEWGSKEGITIIIDGNDVMVCSNNPLSLNSYTEETSYELFVFPSSSIAILAAMSLKGDEDLHNIHKKIGELVQK